MKKQAKLPSDESTEQKIKNAARDVFIRKGYGGTTIREIADEAGLNNALLSYYFRSKEKLFDIVVQEQTAALLDKIYPIVNDELTTIEQKFEAMFDYYTGLLLAQPGVILFVLNEMQNHPKRVADQIETNQMMMASVLARQLKEKLPEVHPMQMIMTGMGVTLFPFIGRAFFQRASGLNNQAFEDLLKERKKILLLLIQSMLTT
jgi:AcrR family transcriptional regulator